jgi:hypothetical protein
VDPAMNKVIEKGIPSEEWENSLTYLQRIPNFSELLGSSRSPIS